MPFYDSTLELFEDSKRNLWIGGTTLTKLGKGSIKTYGVNEGYPKDSNFHSFWEEEGSVWFANGGRSGAGVGLVRYRDEVFEIFGNKVGLSDASIFQVFHDRERNIWLATNKGIKLLREDVITAYTKKDGLDNSEVYPIYRDRKDNIWIGTVTGLNVYANGKFKTVRLEQSNRDAPEHTQWRNGSISVQSIFEDSKGKLWIGADGAIFIVEGTKATTLTDTEGYHVYSIREDKAGNVWAATNKGILRFRNYRIIDRLTIDDGLPSEFMTIIHEDKKGRLWFGGHGGLSEYKNGSFKNFTAAQGLAGNYVRSIYEDSDGTLWIGTYDEGLSRFKDGRFVSYKAKDGLFNNGVFAIEEDADNYFWISSNSGIYRISKNELNQFAEGKISRINSTGYGKLDGMLNSECNGGRQPASVTAADGRIWFPTQEGIVVVDPSIQRNNALAPSVVIESASIERNPIPLDKGIVVEPGERNLQVTFTGISMIKSAQVRFKYMLEGYDPKWIDAGNRRRAFYSYLPPGNYRFLVRAANSEGIWNEKGATIEVEVKPYFYQTNWFIALCVVVGLLIVILIWKKSTYQVAARERTLARLVEEKTEELAKANRELQLLSESDGLTEIGNRRRFEEFLAGEWHRAIRFNTEISLVMLDIDHFKLFNDAYGHLEGDECLKRVAKALSNTIHRPTDLVARFGGEEFAIVLGGTDSAGARQIALQAFESIRELEIPHKDSKTSEHLTTSVGIATVYAKVGMNEDILVGLADDMLYEAKKRGRDRIEYCDLSLVDDIESLIDKEPVEIG
jgi:diguanylate cyclase (GGDEF)-like protein